MDGQHVSLKEIVDTMMLWAEDPGNYLYGGSRALVLTHAKRLLQELNYAGLRSVRIHEAEIAASGKVAVPADFVEYVRVYYCVGNYLMPTFENRHINTLQYESLKDVEEQLILTLTGKRILTPSGDYLTARVKLNESVPATGHPKNWCFLEGYKYDHKNNCFVLDYVPDGVSHVAIEYVADPLLSEPDPAKLCIHKYFEKAMEAGIFYRMIEMRRSVPANEKARAKREWTIKYRDAVKELNAKPQELIQAIMGWKHMRSDQGAYAGMGGQRIPEPKPQEILYMASFIEYVCQTLTKVPEKVRNRLTVSSVSTKQKVTMTVTAEKEVHTAVEVSYGISSRSRAVSQSGKVTIPAGRKTANVDVAADFYGQELQFSIYSVDGVAGADSDMKYIYEIESPVTLEELTPKPVNYIRAAVVVDPSADRNKRIRITYTCAYPTASVVAVQCSTNQPVPLPNYSSVDYLYPNKTTTSFLVDDTFGGQTCLLNIQSVDGTKGALEDSEYIYAVDAALEIVSPRRENRITMESEIRVWRVGLYCMSHYPVASPVLVRIQSGVSSVYDDRLLDTGVNGVLSYPALVAMYGQVCQNSIFRVNGVEGGLSDADFDYVMATPTLSIATPDSLPVVDWNLVRTGGTAESYRVKAVLNQAAGADLTLVYTSANNAATPFGVIRAGELESAEATFQRGTEYTVAIHQIAGVDDPHTGYGYGWDKLNRYPVQKQIVVDALSINYIQPSVEWRLENGTYKLYFKMEAEHRSPAGVYVRYYWGPAADNWTEIHIQPNSSTDDDYINIDIDSVRLIEITGVGDPKQEGVTFDDTYEYRLRDTSLIVPPKPLIDNHIRVTAYTEAGTGRVKLKWAIDYEPASRPAVAFLFEQAGETTLRYWGGLLDNNEFYFDEYGGTDVDLQKAAAKAYGCILNVSMVPDSTGQPGNFSDATYNYILDTPTLTVPLQPENHIQVTASLVANVPTLQFTAAKTTASDLQISLTQNGATVENVFRKNQTAESFAAEASIRGTTCTVAITSVNGVAGVMGDYIYRYILDTSTVNVPEPEPVLIDNHIRVTASLVGNTSTVKIAADYTPASPVVVNLLGVSAVQRTLTTKEDSFAATNALTGRNCQVTIVSVNGVAGAMTDSTYRYILDTSVVTVPKPLENTVTVRDIITVNPFDDDYDYWGLTVGDIIARPEVTLNCHIRLNLKRQAGFQGHGILKIQTTSDFRVTVMDNLLDNCTIERSVTSEIWIRFNVANFSDPVESKAMLDFGENRILRLDVTTF